MSSDEEGEILPRRITEYEFIDHNDKPVSFAFLPLVWSKDEPIDSVKLKMSLSGVSNDGLQKIYKQVLAWRYELSYVNPEIWVLCKGNHWIKLLKPTKLFENVIRSILITIQCLHFVKHNPEATKSSIWLNLTKVFSMYEFAPSESDCMSHISLIRKAAQLDKTLMNSEYIAEILLENPTNGKVLQMEGLPVKRANFIDDDDIDDLCEDDIDLVDNGEDFFDTCCSLCDNGGDILNCEGRCMRSFHATVESGEGSCESLGLSIAQVNAIPSFNCENCLHQQHQCFICGRLGSSDVSSNPEVFPCIAANCGRFYHPRCVAKELRKRKDRQWENIENIIALRETFSCPAHKCYLCKQVEDQEDNDLQFAVCRRCPKSYHRKCLPRELSFENEDNETLQRAWDGLLPKRILIYCLDHEIDPELGTPLRNHIIFPRTSKVAQHVSKQHYMDRVNILPNKRKLILLSNSETERKALERANNLGSIKRRDSTRPVRKGITNPSSGFHKNARYSDLGLGSRGNVKVLAKPKALGTSISEKRNVYSEKSRKLKVVQPDNVDRTLKKSNTVHSVKPLIEKQRCSNLNPIVDAQVEKRIIALMEKVNSSFNVEDFKKKQTAPSNYKSSQIGLDKTLTKVKVEVAVKAVRTALQKVEKGGTIEDAKEICSVGMLCQIPKWKKKLDIYLAPFLHGISYSSYGRHFTKQKKLEEIVERLHWYVQEGDMIVDFCCGSNDFSCLMKKKLESVGKKCRYKNFDLFPPKNDFNFEQRDWFTVNPGDLPEGSRLIMGLNPPFGYKAALANKFVSKALQFKPKLLILIVPPETQRPDSRFYRSRYDLIWEDPHLLAGESFYLPGSCDANEKQLSQWNNTTPPLYLWSRSDWTFKYREISNFCGHSQLFGQSPCTDNPTWNYLYQDKQDCYGDFTNLMNVYGNLPAILDDVPEHTDNTEFDGHRFNGNFNGPDFDNRANTSSLVNSREVNVVGQLETDLHFSPAELADMDILKSCV